MPAKQQQQQPPHLRRLCALVALNDGEVAALGAAAQMPRAVRARRDICREGMPARPSILLSGWAARVRYFADGRRQILHLLLPGDVIDYCHQRSPLGPSAITALTDVSLTALPPVDDAASGLAEAYALGAAIEQGYILRQVARLGRLNAYDRMTDLLLELRDRLDRAGLVTGHCFPMPLTQEVLGDALGLTSVHVNRTLQQMRRDGAIEIRGSMVTMSAPDLLRSRVDYHPVKVSRDPGLQGGGELEP